MDLPEFLSPVFDPSGAIVDHKGAFTIPTPSKLNAPRRAPSSGKATPITRPADAEPRNTKRLKRTTTRSQ